MEVIESWTGEVIALVGDSDPAFSKELLLCLFEDVWIWRETLCYSSTSPKRIILTISIRLLDVWEIKKFYNWFMLIEMKNL